MTTMMMKESRVGECKSRSKESLPTLFLSLVGCDHVLDAVLVEREGRGGRGGKQAQQPVMRPDKGINACSHCRRSHVFMKMDVGSGVDGYSST